MDFGSKNPVQNWLKIQLVKLDYSKLIFQKSSTDQQREKMFSTFTHFWWCLPQTIVVYIPSNLGSKWINVSWIQNTNKFSGHSGWKAGFWVKSLMSVWIEGDRWLRIQASIQYQTYHKIPIMCKNQWQECKQPQDVMSSYVLKWVVLIVGHAV